MKIGKLFCALTLNLKVYITTTYYLSFCLIIMDWDSVDLRKDLGFDADKTLSLYQESPDLDFDNPDDEAGCSMRACGVLNDTVPLYKIGYNETPLISKGILVGDSDAHQEAAKVLLQAFSGCVDALHEDAQPKVCDLMEDVRLKCNYEIRTLKSVRNGPVKYMFNAFEKCYDIQNKCTTYHGTSSASAQSICETGFRGAAGERAMFGRGIYCSKHFWGGCAYGPPEGKDKTQTVLVCDLLQGPIDFGQKNQVKFGHDKDGKEILTLTDSTQTILCASRDSQLCPKYLIELRYCSECQHTSDHLRYVPIYHQDIWKLIREQKVDRDLKRLAEVPGGSFLRQNNSTSSNQPSQVPSVNPNLAVPGNSTVVQRPTKHVVTSGKEIPEHGGFKKGDKVKLTGMPQKFTVFNDQEVELKKIVHLGRFARYLVEVDKAYNDLAVKFNDTRNITLSPSLNAEKHWLICLREHLKSSVLGKRPAV